MDRTRSEEVNQEEFNEQLQYLLDSDLIVRAHAGMILKDKELSEEEKSEKLKEFILSKNKEVTWNDLVQRIRERQESGYKTKLPTKKEKVSFMKHYLKNQANYKMSDFTGRSDAEIEKTFYETYARLNTSSKEDITRKKKREPQVLESDIAKKL